MSLAGNMLSGLIGQINVPALVAELVGQAGLTPLQAQAAAQTIVAEILAYPAHRAAMQEASRQAVALFAGRLDQIDMALDRIAARLDRLAAHITEGDDDNGRPGIGGVANH